jgi:hypothetical protein
VVTHQLSEELAWACGGHGEMLIAKIILFLCSEEERKNLKTSEEMEITVETACVIFPSRSKVYSYPKNLSCVLFKQKNVGGTLSVLDFI